MRVKVKCVHIVANSGNIKTMYMNIDQIAIDY